MLSNIKEKFGETSLLAIVPAVGYVVAISHAYGYANYFNYPSDFISISLEMTLKSSLWAVLYLFGVFIWLKNIILLSNTNTKVGVLFRNIYYFTAFPVIGVFVSGFNELFIKIFIGSIVIAFTATLAIPLFKMKGASYSESFVSSNKYTFGNDDHEEQITADKALSISLTSMLILIGICIGAGHISAKGKNDFYKFTLNKENYVLMSVYGNKVVAASYLPEQNKYREEFIVISLNDNKLEKLQKIPKPTKLDI